MTLSVSCADFRLLSGQPQSSWTEAYPIILSLRETRPVEAVLVAPDVQLSSANQREPARAFIQSVGSQSVDLLVRAPGPGDQIVPSGAPC